MAKFKKNPFASKSPFNKPNFFQSNSANQNSNSEGNLFFQFRWHDGQ
jgi:hypothetical protein